MSAWLVTIVVSYLTKPMPESVSLTGLVYGLTIIPDDGSTKEIYEKPIFWAVVVATVLFILNIVFF